MKRNILFLILLIGIVVMFANKIYCQGISITGGNVSLTISTATAGEEPDSVYNTDTGLNYWGIYWNPARYKITAKTNLSSPKFTLTVEAIQIVTSTSGYIPVGGTAQGEVTLSTTAQSIITDLKEGRSWNPHSCTLRYTTSATLSQGTGTDFHTITYTIIYTGSPF